MELPTAGDCVVLGWAFDDDKITFLVLGRKINEDGQTVYVVGEVDEIGPDIPLRGTVFVTPHLARRVWTRRINGASPETPGRSPGYPRRCVCGKYLATNETDLDEHIAAMMHVDDGDSHA